ncbi:MAG: hypothetical protein ACM3PE_01905 [Deltaproteobacteria bacterium]
MIPNTFELAIIGMGPAGIGVAIAMQSTPVIKNAICFERGAEVGNKNCNIITNDACCNLDACHIISGIGGASNLSSGKLSLFPAGSGLISFFPTEQELKDVMFEVIHSLEENAGLKKVEIDNETISKTQEHYKANNITYKYYDVYEFDGDKYLNNLSETIKSLIKSGLQVHTNSEVVAINRDETTLCYTITACENGMINRYSVRNVVFAIGSSEIDQSLGSTFVGETASSYEVGMRVEAKSECFGKHLSSHGDLKLKYKSGRTYCVTRGGAIVSYRTDGLFLLEGYINPIQRTDYSNLAVLIKVDDNKELTEFLQNYRELFDGVPVRQKYTDYLLGNPSSDSVYTTLSTSKIGDINKMFSDSINKALREFINHVINETMHIKQEELTIVAPELKILRNIELNDQFEVAPNLFVVGAATGKFRGILQSVCSGIQCGKYVLRR